MDDVGGFMGFPEMGNIPIAGWFIMEKSD